MARQEQFDAPRTSDPSSGLIATYSTAASQQPMRRIDSDLQFDWTDQSPDVRLAGDRFAAAWRGKLSVPGTATYRFHAFVDGRFTLRIGGKTVLDAESSPAAWISSRAMDLEFGQHDFEAAYAKTSPRARVGLYWQSSKFDLEPISSRWFTHNAGRGPSLRLFERGRELVRAYRCAACHEVPGDQVNRPAPSLERLAGAVDPDWLVHWLERPAGHAAPSRMPAFHLTADEARAVSSYVLQPSKQAPVFADKKPTGKPAAGESLVRSIGCLACHTLGASGQATLFGGGPLDHVADKRPAGFFAEWLKRPERLNPDHRMPVFTLSNAEVDDLAAYLATLRSDDLQRRELQPVPDLAAHGKRIIESRRCAACHAIPGVEPPPRTAVRLVGSGTSARSTGCVAEPDATRNRPGFRLSEPDREAIRAFVNQVPERSTAESEYELGRRLLRELNCASCHARDLEHGLEPARWGRTADDGPDAELAKLRGELEPPSLTSAGDKFIDDALANLVRGGLPPRRPWLKVRMPRFNHDPAEQAAIVHHLIAHDRIPAGIPRQSLATAGSTEELEPAAALAAGHQLVSSRGFGCMSCHTVGKHQPKGVAVNARGSDLLRVGERLRRDWFLRWVRDPARIVPGMEMPSITVAVRGVLGDRLEAQIESLWHALNSTAFVVPSDRDTAQQILSLAAGDEPVVLRDVLHDAPPGTGWCPRSFAIGLPNRHNLLFDLDTANLRAWWIGDFARERTEGKTWLWEPAGLPVWGKESAIAAIAWRDPRSGKLSVPSDDEGPAVALRMWKRSAQMVQFTYELRPGGQPVTVTESIEPLERGDAGGFSRHIAVEGDWAGREPVALVSGGAMAKDSESLHVSGPVGQSIVRVVGGGKWEPVELAAADGSRATCHAAALVSVRGDAARKSEIRLEYLVADGHAAASQTTRAHAVGQPQGTAGADRVASGTFRASWSREQQPIVPGHELDRVALNAVVMPTAIAFQPDGTTLVASLKGQVFAARDSDGDQFEDQWRPIGDHLAAPFGILADGDSVIVGHKPELLRLELNPDGAVDRTVVIAQDWGYTEDYHDWTFGPVRDEQGRIYIATASDYAHKNRPVTARRRRGAMLRLDPATGAIEELARGLRYPTGVAMNRHGEVFFTDNQGVQNTFNELNHLVPGSRYGLPSQDDPPADEDPWWDRAAAIQIPHPWTRSVNGICFLESGGRWGPFEGHGIGCEYDTRGLIRFSLQKVGDTYQGAAYPFALPEDRVPSERRLLGPISCAVGPSGDLYVGGIRDSGWGGGNNIGELVRIRPTASLPLGIREVRATREGFAIEFTGAVDAGRAADASNYLIASYRRVWKGAYATPDSDRLEERVLSVEVNPDRTAVAVKLAELRPGFVYEIALRSIGGDAQLWPAQAYYTLHVVP